MSDSCQRRRRKPSNRARGKKGFTLLEILVVLALVGLMTAFTLPQFSIVRDRLTFTLNRESFERDLGGLAYAAFKDGRPVILKGQYPRPPGGDKAPEKDEEFDSKEPLFLEPGQLRPAPPVIAADAELPLPEDWRVTVAKPIIFQASGFCEGGTVDLLIGDLRYTYDLKAPTCEVALQK